MSDVHQIGAGQKSHHDLRNRNRCGEQTAAENRCRGLALNL